MTLPNEALVAKLCHFTTKVKEILTSGNVTF